MKTHSISGEEPANNAGGTKGLLIGASIGVTAGLIIGALLGGKEKIIILGSIGLLAGGGIGYSGKKGLMN